MKSFPSAIGLALPTLTLFLVAGACGDDSGETTGSGGGTTGTSTSSSSPTTSTSSSPTTGTSGEGGSGAGNPTNSGGGSPTSSSSSGSGGDGAGGQILPGDFDCTDPVGALGNLVATPFVALGEHPDCDPGQGGVPCNPMQFRQAPGDTDRFFAVAKKGKIYVVRDGAVTGTFLDISGQVADDGEQGLLGLAFHSDYETNGRFFVNYTANNGETYVAEYTVSGDPDVANTTEVGRVIQAPGYQSNHNGGAVEFGPDGFLYVSVGDGGEQGDPNCRAQNLSLRAGKILRADISTPGTYPGAANNFPGADEYVFDVGFRNPWRMSFDVCNGNLWIGDVGQGEWEEVTVHPAGAPPLNHGWNMREGAHDYSNDCTPASNDLTEPVLDYSHNGEGNSITGGFVYRGSSIPALRGAYLFGDFGSGRVWSTRWAPGDAIPAAKTEHPDLNLGGNSLAAFGQDNAGEVYLLDIGGDILRIESE